MQERIKSLIQQLNQGLYGKEEAIKLALLSAVAGESIFFLGPPGTAKSMIASRIHKAFKDTNYFEYLMNEFSTPDEIFGPIKLKGLDDGIYEKNTTGYLPEAHIAFLDEIWKSGPAILNTLLTIINEKKFRNGQNVLPANLQILLAASNELPRENSGLDALYDRFTIRHIVNPVTDESDFFNLVEGKSNELKISQENLLSMPEIQSWKEQINNVELSEITKKVIKEIRQEMVLRNSQESRNSKDKFYVSDRRWKKIVNLLKTSAFLNGRTQVDISDCLLISYCVWNNLAQKEECEKFLFDIYFDYGFLLNTELKTLQEEVEDFETYVEETFFDSEKIKINYESDVLEITKNSTLNKYNTLKDKLQKNEKIFIKNIVHFTIFLKNNIFCSEQSINLLLNNKQLKDLQNQFKSFALDLEKIKSSFIDL